jgi:hypothetical protein
MLFVDDMFVAIQSMIEINRLKAQLDKNISVGSSRSSKTNLGHRSI